jgi:hypothetical protein
MNQSPWHRHVDGVFFLMLVVLGLMIGFVGYYLLSGLTHPGQ